MTGHSNAEMSRMSLNLDNISCLFSVVYEFSAFIKVKNANVQILFWFDKDDDLRGHAFQGQIPVRWSRNYKAFISHFTARHFFTHQPCLLQQSHQPTSILWPCFVWFVLRVKPTFITKAALSILLTPLPWGDAWGISFWLGFLSMAVSKKKCDIGYGVLRCPSSFKVLHWALEVGFLRREVHAGWGRKRFTG